MKRVYLLFVLISLISSTAFTQWQYNGSNIYYDSGSVGIGTDNTVSGLKLLVHSDVDNGGLPLRVQRTDAANGSWAIQDWLNANEEVMRITYSGRLGIGTDIPSEKLDVIGKIKSYGLILTSPNGDEWEITVDNNGNLITDIVSKTENVEYDTEIIVSPNPTSDIVTISTKEWINDYMFIDVFSIQGQLIKSCQVENNTTTINTSVLKSGTYIIKLRDINNVVYKEEKLLIIK